jgi:serine palmitoyltransferase
MGFATNSLSIPILATKGTLIISDSLNHSSIIEGYKLSEASVNIFNHNGKIIID